MDAQDSNFTNDDDGTTHDDGETPTRAAVSETLRTWPRPDPGPTQESGMRYGRFCGTRGPKNQKPKVGGGTGTQEKTLSPLRCSNLHADRRCVIRPQGPKSSQDQRLEPYILHSTVPLRADTHHTSTPCPSHAAVSLAPDNEASLAQQAC